MSHNFVADSPLRHTYPYGRRDLEVPFGTAEELRANVARAHADVPDCRRVVVVVDEGDLEAIATCEEAGLRYAIDVQLPDGRDVSLMVSEPDWVTAQSTDIDDLELT